jgi:hypothetical protein
VEALMPDRSTETHVTFRYPFTLRSSDGLLPAGTYRLVIDEEEILGLSFPAYRRTAGTLHTPAVSVVATHQQAFPVEPGELEGALEADLRGPPVSSSGT